MANEQKKTSELPSITSANNTDVIVVLTSSSSNAQTSIITTQNLLSNSNLKFVGQIVSANNITPANSTSLTIQQGSIIFDDSYLYIAISDNNLRRISLGGSF